MRNAVPAWMAVMFDLCLGWRKGYRWSALATLSSWNGRGGARPCRSVVWKILLRRKSGLAGNSGLW